MLLRNVKTVQPSPKDMVVHHFLRSDVKDISVDVKDDNGKVVGTKRFRTPFTSVIPDEEFENEALSVDLFSVENLQAVGQDPFKGKPIAAPLFRGTLDSIGVAVDSLNDFDYNSLTEADFEQPSQTSKTD